MCSVAGCEKKAVCRTWCPMHYRRWLTHGNTETVLTRRVNLIGQRFGFLVVTGFHSGGRIIKWNTHCDCGSDSVVQASHLTSGHTKSCGCKTGLPTDVRTMLLVKGSYLRNAAERGHSWSLSDDEFQKMIFSPCHYCGIERSNTWTQNGERYNGVDRIDNTLGYFSSNCVPCCGGCNHMKGSMPATDFLSAVQRISRWNHGA